MYLLTVLPSAMHERGYSEPPKPGVSRTRRENAIGTFPFNCMLSAL